MDKVPHGRPRSFSDGDTNFAEFQFRQAAQESLAAAERSHRQMHRIARIADAARPAFGGAAFVICAQEVGRQWCRLKPWQVAAVAIIYAVLIRTIIRDIMRVSR